MTNANPIRAIRLAAALTAAWYLTPASLASADNDVLATVDGKVAVTVSDVLDLYQGTLAPDSAPTVTAADVADVVDTLVTAEILVREAEAAGYADDEYILKRCTAFRQKLLEDAIWEDLLNEEPITEDHLRAFYEIDAHWRKYSSLTVKNREEAETAHRDLLAGRPWDEVVREYSISEREKENGGVSKTPMAYDGKTACRAVYAAPVGGYTPPVPANDGIRWHVYRVDKIVHGRTRTYDESRANVNAMFEDFIGGERRKRRAAELRNVYEVKRDADMWRDLHQLPFAEFKQKWGTDDAVVSKAGSVPVAGRAFAYVITDFFYLGDEDMDAYRAAEPEDFTYVTDKILTNFEDKALLAYGALVRGLDKTPAFVHEYTKHRNELITDVFVTREFVAGLPPITDADCELYYEQHKDEFVIPEASEVYAVVMPEREKLEDFYARVSAGADLVDTGEAYNQARGEELMDMYEPPPELPPEKEEWLGVVRILRVPDPAQPDGAFAAELRPHAFPFTRLKELSDIFQLRDGRWAFFAPIYYQPFRAETLEDPGTKLKCQKEAWAEFYAREETEILADEWLASLRGRHDVVLVQERFDELAAQVNAAP